MIQVLECGLQVICLLHIAKIYGDSNTAQNLIWHKDAIAILAGLYFVVNRKIHNIHQLCHTIHPLIADPNYIIADYI